MSQTEDRRENYIDNLNNVLHYLWNVSDDSTEEELDLAAYVIEVRDYFLKELGEFDEEAS